MQCVKRNTEIVIEFECCDLRKCIHGACRNAFNRALPECGSMGDTIPQGVQVHPK